MARTLTDGVRVTLRVQPRASRTVIAGRHGDGWKIKIAAPPVDGAANAELVRFLAELLDVAKSSVRIVRGKRSRTKVVEIAGVRAERVGSVLDDAAR